MAPTCCCTATTILHMLNWLAGPGGARVPAVGVPSASAAPGIAKNAAAYNLYAIDGAPGAWRCEMVSRGASTPAARSCEAESGYAIASGRAKARASLC